MLHGLAHLERPIVERSSTGGQRAREWFGSVSLKGVWIGGRRSVVLLNRAVTQLVYTASQHFLGVLSAITGGTQHGWMEWAVGAMHWWRLLCATVTGRFVDSANGC
jgi:hypothetical protein